LDLPVKSSQANSQLLFSAYTERIPPLGTKVRLVLKPQLEEKKGDAKSGEDPKDAPKKAADGS
jgi:hypothetical protein